MGLPFPIQETYSAGMRRDMSRDQLPGGSVWNMVDYFPDVLQAPARKRGGWTWGSPTFAGSAVDRLAYPEFSGGSQLVAIDNQSTAHLWKINSSSSATDEGALLTTIGQPVFYRNKLIIPAYDGTTVPKTYDGSSIASLSGAPAGMYATSYLDHAVLGGTAADPTSVYFAAPGDPTTWDLTNSIISTQRTLSGLAALKSMILVFANDATQRIRGTTPPDSSGTGDMILENLFSVGCIDHRSIAPWNDKVVFADTDGVYMTDGATFLDLTLAGGMVKYWRDILATYTSSWRIVGTVYRNLYIVSVQNGSTFVDCLACDLNRRVWFRLSNINARCFTVAQGTFKDLYMGLASTDRVARLTDIFNPSSSNKADADGTNVLPVVEIPMQQGYVRIRGRKWVPSQGITTWKWLYTSYDIRDAGTDGPYFQVGYCTDPSAATYTTITPTLPAGTKKLRGRLPLRFGANTVGIKIAQVNPSADTRLYALEADYNTREVGSLG